MIAAIQLLKERPVTDERRLVAEFDGPVAYEIPIKRGEEGKYYLFVDMQKSPLDAAIETLM